jgi:hypothetical protein
MGVEPFEIIPINFKLTAEAREAIRLFTEAAEQGEGEALVPAVSWMSEYEEPSRQVVDKGLGLGWFVSNKIPAEAIQMIDGLKMAFAVTRKDAEKFEGRTIDFSQLGGFRFVDPD